MGAIYSSGRNSIVNTVSVSIQNTSSFPVPGNNPTPVHAAITAATGGDRVIYTVPASKILYVFSAWAYNDSAAVTGWISDGDGVAIDNAIAPIASTAGKVSVTHNGGGAPLAKITAGKSITVAPSASSTQVGISGVLVDA